MEVLFLNWRAVHTMQNILPVVDQALMKAEVSLADINAVAFTQAPGLIGSLLVGAQLPNHLLFH